MKTLVVRHWAMCAAVVAASALAFNAWGTTYYVSPTGNDNNSGTDPSQPWQSVAKVDNAVFAPGSQILFQRGGVWGESLAPSCSGTAAAPITFSDYGSSSLAKPEFTGATTLQASGFSLVPGTTSAYSIPMSAAWVGSVLANDQFLHEPALIAPSYNPYQIVYSTANTWFYDGAKLFVNTGGASPLASGETFSAVVREDAINITGQSYINVSNMTVEDTARENSGYGIRVQSSTGINLTNCDVFNAGKHSVGVINSDGFVGTGLNASSLMPDQGFGGATAFVSYSDQFRINVPTTSQWTNCTVSNVESDYLAFYSHGEGLKSVTIQNMVANGNGIAIGGTQQVSTITGGSIQGASLSLSGNTIADGVRITGGYNQISVSGSGNVVQNCVVSGGDLYWSYHAVVVDSGSGNTYRFNTFVNNDSVNGLEASAFAFISPDTSGTEIYGNIISSQLYFIHDWLSNFLNVTSDQNLLTGDFSIILSNGAVIDWNQWKADGFDVDSIISDPQFADAADSNFDLTSGSAAIGAGQLPDTEADLENWLNWNLGPQVDQAGTGMASIEFIPSPEPLSAAVLICVLPLLSRRRRGGCSGT